MCASLGDRVYGPHQKVNLLIPRHIPGSFCEFRFSCLTRSALTGATTAASPQPPREHHKGTPLRTQSAIGAHFVKRLIPGHIPASFPTVGFARRIQIQPRVAHTSLLSFPTRRSSDLSMDRTKKLIC